MAVWAEWDAFSGRGKGVPCEEVRPNGRLAIGGAPLTRAELGKRFDRFRDEMHRELRHYVTKADVANLKT